MKILHKELVGGPHDGAIAVGPMVPVLRIDTYQGEDVPPVTSFYHRTAQRNIDNEPIYLYEPLYRSSKTKHP